MKIVHPHTAHELFKTPCKLFIIQTNIQCFHSHSTGGTGLEYIEKLLNILCNS